MAHTHFKGLKTSTAATDQTITSTTDSAAGVRFPAATLKCSLRHHCVQNGSATLPQPRIQEATEDVWPDGTFI
jgi:hypothetical protein